MAARRARSTPDAASLGSTPCRLPPRPRRRRRRRQLGLHIQQSLLHAGAQVEVESNV